MPKRQWLHTSNLSDVERAFRSIKSIDLKVRPIYHRLGPRVKAHVFLCMLAYYVEWHMRQALAPMLFDDHEKQAAQLERKSILAPAQRSEAAMKKACSKRCDNRMPVHSFCTLLEDLSTGDGSVELKAGEMCVVPKGVEHKPFSDGDSYE